MYLFVHHDDVIKGKHFPRYWPFVNGEFRVLRPVTGSFAVLFNLRLNKWLNKQSWGWWLETLSCPLWRHRNEHGLLHTTENYSVLKRYRRSWCYNIVYLCEILTKWYVASYGKYGKQKNSVYGGHFGDHFLKVFLRVDRLANLCNIEYQVVMTCFTKGVQSY